MPMRCWPARMRAAEAIARSCRHKAANVERDPFEKGERALLNHGHTFATPSRRTGLFGPGPAMR